MNFICYYNGKYIPESEVSLSFHDLGFQRSFVVWDYLRTYNHIPFNKEWHADKIMNSIRYMNLSVDFSTDMFLEILKTLFEKNKNILLSEYEYGVKTMVTGGYNNIPTILMYIEKFDTLEYKDMRKNGISLLVQHQKRKDAEIKNIDYRTLYRAQAEIKKLGCLEILYVDEGYVYEAGTSNIFFVKDNILITPSEHIYQGSTRDYVIGLANSLDILVEERPVTWNECIHADEIFITASKKEILPVVGLYDNTIKNTFNIGIMTTLLIQAFENKKQE